MARQLHAMFDADAAKAAGIPFAADDYAHAFMSPEIKNSVSGRAVYGPNAVLEWFYGHTFKDEHGVLLELFRNRLGKTDRDRFDAMAKARLAPRDDAVFHKMLEEHLAITPSGEHMEGRVGKVIVGFRQVGERLDTREALHSILARRRAVGMGIDSAKVQRIADHSRKPLLWPIYAGENEERQRPGGGAADAFPPPELLMALSTNESYAFAAAANDARLALLDEGTSHGILQGLSGAEPNDPDASITGTLGATWSLAATAFGASVDNAPGAKATAAAIADVTIAATITLGYVVASSSDDGSTRKNPHIEGSVGASGTAGTDYDWVFNTLSFVSGATGSISSWTVTQPQGPTSA